MSGEGVLVAVGGGEDKREAMHVLRRALDHAPPAPRVAILPCASADPAWAAQLHVEAFRALGASAVDVLDVRTPAEAALAANVARVRDADIVYMTGGDQARLCAILARTPLHAMLRKRLRAGGVVAGTSAGAAAMSATMIAEGDTTLRKGGVRLAPGLSLLPHAILDTHFTERGRFARLVEAVSTHPSLLGIGLGEDTAILVRGHDVEVVGSGTVMIVDGREIQRSNVAHAPERQPVDVERIIVHCLSAGRAFALPEDAPVAHLARTKARA